MKRSEVIKIIQTILEEVTYKSLAETRAEKILNKLEAVGMLPPGYDYTIEHTNGKMEIYLDEWEPE